MIGQNPNWTEIVRKLLESQTQIELSKKTGVSQSVISDLNQGKPKKRISYDYGIAFCLLYTSDAADDTR
jgi:predicted transcriptional regulator